MNGPLNSRTGHESAVAHIRCAAAGPNSVTADQMWRETQHPFVGGDGSNPTTRSTRHE